MVTGTLSGRHLCYNPILGHVDLVSPSAVRAGASPLNGINPPAACPGSRLSSVIAAVFFGEGGGDFLNSLIFYFFLHLYLVVASKEKCEEPASVRAVLL